WSRGLGDVYKRQGITRVISYLKNSKTKYQNLILVDTGDFFPVRTDTTTAKFILSLLKLANYDVVVVGDQEVLSGVDNFICLVEEYKLPVLSTNLKFTTMLTTPTVTIPYLIKKFRSFKIGIISLNTEETFMLCPEEVTQKITILQPNNIETIIKNLRQSCDIIVLLSHGGHQYDREIAKLYPDVDLIIGGHNQILLNQPVRISKTTIVQAGSNGEYVGKIIFLIDRDKKLLTFDYEPVLMDENVKEDSTVISLIQNYKFQLKNR
ncbi:MAG: hypothetical protein N2Z73_04660, partial [Endomicrobia bacterium]|nr:hypothetical protein [Endomicrobiia bacterium]